MEIKKTVTLSFETTKGNELEEGQEILYSGKDGVTKAGIYRGLGKAGCIKIEDAMTPGERNIRVDSIEKLTAVHIEYMEG